MALPTDVCTEMFEIFFSISFVAKNMILKAKHLILKTSVKQLRVRNLVRLNDKIIFFLSVNKLFYFNL